jgi:uncharacterized protein (TIGR04255 family)
MPYIVRYRFRREEDGSPLFQLGPGVATVNFTQQYTWEAFLERALYLRKTLLSVYNPPLETQMTVLRYRNAIPFNYNNRNILNFLQTKLNSTVKLPKYIPSHVSRTQFPTTMRMQFSFDMNDPVGKAAVTLTTGKKRENERETDHIIFETEFASVGKDAPDLKQEEQFRDWLTRTHKVLHEWFFAVIDGDLLEQYRDGK